MAKGVDNLGFDADPAHLKFTPPEGKDVGVSVRNLCKVYNLVKKGEKKVAVNRLSLDFYQNEVTALLGHNGAGKSTTM